ncbi:MAG: T9SS type A sorting domain-containing protein [Bacteroidetes bacterium]|nr:T9SS type A sorting domain-containing protein [Bacteroidota bacterium]MBU1720533.1 T9SS type A sorting domain-containing protein [Bacteroidota bacterium]
MKIRLVSFIMLAVCSLNVRSQITIETDTNLINLTAWVEQNFAGSGIVITNISFNNASVGSGGTVPNGVFGNFTNGFTSDIGISTGLVLSSGSVMSIPQAVGGFASTTNSTPGDATLQALAGNPTYDAAVLEFDFTNMSDQFLIKYAFGSEEYPEYVCSTYNDVFGIFISGPNPAGGNYLDKNIANIPGTILPVAINSVNQGDTNLSYPGSSCMSLDYAWMYIDNQTLNGQTIVYDGFTRPIVGQAAIIPGQTYHLKIAVADVGDAIYDSGLFIERSDITVCDSIAVDLGPDIYTCNNDPIFLSIDPGYYAYNWSTGSQTHSTTIYPASLAAGANVISLTAVNDSGCTATGQMTIHRIDTLIQQPLGPDQDLCMGEPLLLSVPTHYTTLWSTGETTSSIHVTPTGGLPGLQTVWVRYENALGCVAFDTLEINFIEPAPLSLGNDVESCAGHPVTLDAGPGFIQYQWFNGDTTQIIILNDPVGPSTVAATIAVTDTFGCTSHDTVMVSFMGFVDVDAGQNLIHCSSESMVSLSPEITGNYSSVSWSTSGSGHFADSLNLNASYFPDTNDVNAGSVYLHLVAAGTCGNGTDSLLVTIADSTVVLALDTVMACPGVSFTLSAAGSSGTYSWTPAAYLSSPSVPNPVGMIDHDTVFVVSLTNSCGTATDTTRLIINPAASADLGSDTSVCANETLILTAPGGNSSYIWSNGATSQQTTFHPPLTGSIEISLTTTNASGCSDSDTLLLHSLPVPTVSLGNDLAVCISDTLEFDAGTGFDSYLWTNSETTHAITVFASTLGTGNSTIGVEVENSSGCSNSDHVNITVFALPTFTVSGLLHACLDDTLLLHASNSTLTYTWSVGQTSQDAMIPGTLLGAGPHNISVTGVNAGGCSHTEIVTVLFDNAPVVYAGNDTMICEGVNTVLLGTATANHYESISWTTTGSGIISDASAVNPYYAIGTQDTSGTITFTITATSTACGDRHDQMQISIQQLPWVNAGPDKTICYGDATTIEGSGSADFFQWTPASGLSSTSTLNPTASPTTTIEYIILGTNSCGSDYDSVIVEVNPVPAINLGNDTSICENATIIFDAGAGYAQYHWSNGQNARYGIYDAAMLGLGNTTVDVTVTDANGCTGSDALLLGVVQCSGLTEYVSATGFSAFPNPVGEVLNFRCPENISISIVEIQDITGRIVYTEKIEGNTAQQIDVRGLPEGVYVLKFYAGDGGQYAVPFVKE